MPLPALAIEGAVMAAPYAKDAAVSVVKKLPPSVRKRISEQYKKLTGRSVSPNALVRETNVSNDRAVLVAKAAVASGAVRAADFLDPMRGSRDDNAFAVLRQVEADLHGRSEAAHPGIVSGDTAVMNAQMDVLIRVGRVLRSNFGSIENAIMVQQALTLPKDGDWDNLRSLERRGAL